MRVLLYLYYPFYDKHLAGGVQVSVRKLVDKLLTKYPDIKLSIVCPHSDLHNFPENIPLHPILHDLEQNGLNPIDLYNDLLILEQMADDSDVIWLVDRRFPVRTAKPKLLSMNTFCYERELKAFFESEWDRVVFNSEYLKNQLINCTTKREDATVIPYFVDDDFRKQEKMRCSSRMSRYFEFEFDKKYILYPHRPEAEKGHLEAILILEELIRYDSKYCLLIPMPPNSRNADVFSENDFIQGLKQIIAVKGLEENVVFHNWIDYSDLPYYYSMGEYSLFLSKLPETFGFVLINSISCGTPTISYGVGALTEVVPPGRGHLVVPVGDYHSITKLILAGEGQDEVVHDTDMVIEKYSLDRVATQYYQLFVALGRTTVNQLV
ncbi:glycosyltransferase family 4 protein [Paenibacillus lautus]|uniref:glycosyltransferase family 4 protein n=1 Tax=Paenibacillus lautus TaxID=1401 RepID=UPI003D282A4F